MLLCHLHETLRVIVRIVPVEVVHLELYEVHLGVLREELVQAIGIIVHGETHVADLSGGFLLLRPIPHAILVELGRTLAAHVVVQEVVHVIGTKALERDVEAFLGGLLIGHCPRQAFGGNGERLARIACDGLALVIDERSVEVGVAGLHEGIDHLLELGDVDALDVVFVEEREPHAAETHLGSGKNSVIHGMVLSSAANALLA